MTPRNRIAITAACAAAALAQTANADRAVQIQSVDFDAGTIELFNFADADVDLTGWRFCTHDFDQQRRYTAASGLNGVTIEAGTSVFIHFDNDAPVGDPDRINRSTIGGNFATPLDRDAYGMQIYFPASNGNVSFGNSSLIADHIQWNTDGSGVGDAERRTQQAVNEGLWTTIGDFIPTTAESLSITLNDVSGDEAGSPSEYDVAEPTEPCPGDTDGDNDVDPDDLFLLLANFGQIGSTGPAFGDLDSDSDTDPDDLFALLAVFGTNCIP